MGDEFDPTAFEQDGPAEDFFAAAAAEDAEGEDGNAADEFKTTRDAVLFVIDCRQSMLHDNANGDVYFETVLNAAAQFLKTKIITNENDKCGILLYNTREQKNPMDFPNICVLQDLDLPDATRIRELQNMTEGFDFKQKFGFAPKDVPLFQVLWTCQTIFSNNTNKNFTKRIFLFTNEDDPSKGDESIKNRSLQRAHDLEEAGVTIELFALNPVDHDFDATLFYQDLIAVDDEDVGSRLAVNGSTKVEELTRKIRQKEFKKRAVGKVNFAISPNMEIAVRFFSMIQEAKKPNPIQLEAKSNKPLKSETKWICADTGSILFEPQIRTFQPFGGEKVPFSKAEMAEVKKFDTPGMKLMGFKPLERLKTYHNTRHSYFLYPDDEMVKGSSLAFAALHAKMLEHKKMAIVRFIPRENVIPRFGALWPQAEEMDENGFQTAPPGFHLITLPYADDIRPLKVGANVPVAERDAIVKAKAVVKSLTIDFDSRNFENPAIQRFYAGLQALALQEGQPEECEDSLVPDVEGIRAYKPLLDDWMQAVGDLQAAPKATRKRKADDEGGDEPKRAKKPVPAADNVAQLAASDAIKKLTVDQLKGYLSGQKLPVSGKKDDLIARIRKHLGINV
eukprot:GILK01002839.1.p1 GENE.GILK01002839.1~~GILK01002839.1.p1  ORF type:complete len:631 (-),score=167.71 GILK01002839.1:47-1906(-)